MVTKSKAMPKGLAVRKKKTPRTPVIRRGGKKVGHSFEGWETWEAAEFSRKRDAAREFYYENMQYNDLAPDVWDWMKSNKYSATEIKYARAFGVPINVAIWCRLLNDGMPDYNPKYAAYMESCPGVSGVVKPTSEFIKTHVAQAIERGKSMVIVENPESKTKKNAYVPSIQERMKEVAYEMAEELEQGIDNFITDPDGFDPGSFKIAAMLRGKQAKAGHARLIKNLFTSELAEYTLLMSKECPDDLMEGYKKYGKKNIKKMFDYLTQIITACDQIAGEAKITRAPRKVKLKSPEQLTKNVKFKATDDRYGVVSIPPAQIIGASAILVFNTKTRKIGIYHADKNAQVLNVKGSSITGFDETRSQQKTLRKPELQLKELKALNTLKRNQTWMDGIKAVGTALTGRINSDIMILKVFK